MKRISPPRLSKRSVRQHGSVIVEFALVLTLLITLMAGIFEFGRAFWYYDTLSKATRDGARLMAMVATTDIASGVGLTQTRVVNAVSAAGVPNFSSNQCHSDLPDNGLRYNSLHQWRDSLGVRVQIVGYTMTIGQFIPFLIGANSNYTTTLSPHTTMRYMPLGTAP